MTYGEAIYQLTNFEGTYETPSLEAIELAVEVLKKVEQLEKENRELKELKTPKKPINIIYDDGYIEYWNCPHCHIQHSNEIAAFCDNCGQAIR